MEPSKCPVCIRPNEYVMSLEFFDGWIWFHTDVYKWTKKVKSKFIKDLNTVQSLLPLPLVALVKEEDTKLAKFGDKLGWTKGNTVMLNDGTKASIYKWEGK